MKRGCGKWASAYHDKHPFHVLMNEGALPREAVKGWVTNRFYYQRNIPRKDAAILANIPLREVRREWLHRITDHDGVPGGDEGGIEAWLRLGEACGIPRDHSWKAAMSNRGAHRGGCLRGLCADSAMAGGGCVLTYGNVRPQLDGGAAGCVERHYDWIDPKGLDYFRRRLVEAPRDSREGLTLTLKYCDTRELQEAAVGALIFKCNLLWLLLDAIDRRYRPAAKPQ